jgi:hypothetical protein
VELEDIVVRLGERRRTLVARGELPRFDRLDPERLDDRVKGMHCTFKSQL